ncbi:MAG TPA: tRNA uracil 4-sulfurtransferase ThiI [bacterium]|jgi:thiamine biosynthesis protein ThiI|nr:tRNA uracil 4-sulfurtransferase ThiI [bacterium]
MEPVLLVRYGEIGLKGRNRPFFIDRLAGNIAAQVGEAASVRAHFGRVFVRPRGGDDDLDALAASVRRTFGVVSLSPAWAVPSRLDEIGAAAERVTARALARRPRASFKVDTRRADKRFAYTSGDVNTIIGRRLQDRFGLPVNVTAPDLTVTVEIRDETFLFTETLPGPGGLPVGTGGRAVALLSGGIDSPVAAWMAARRGLDVIPLHCYSFPFVNERSKMKVLDLCRTLATYAGPLRCWIGFFTEIQRAIQLAVTAELRVTVMRRMMLRLAEGVAAREGALAVITGESAGQVASQTLASIATIDAVAGGPVLRPLIGMDKTEITARAREIGTYEISVLPYEDCCSLFLPAHPRTHPEDAEVAREERALPIDDLLTEALSRSEVLTVSARETPHLIGLSSS